jgi:uncharacterized protein with GYD domain
MPAFVSLVHWTKQGVTNYKDTTSRAEQFTKLVENSGGRVRELLWTIGDYDMVTVAEFPDEKSATAALLQVSAAGNIRTNTLRAFDADEMGDILRRTS